MIRLSGRPQAPSLRPNKNLCESVKSVDEQSVCGPLDDADTRHRCGGYVRDENRTSNVSSRGEEGLATDEHGFSRMKRRAFAPPRNQADFRLPQFAIRALPHARDLQLPASFHSPGHARPVGEVVTKDARADCERTRRTGSNEP